MDQNFSVFGEKKNEFELMLLKFLRKELDKNTISYDDFRYICRDILTLMAEVEVEGQFLVVLYMLSEQWPVVKPLFEAEKMKNLGVHADEDKDDKILELKNKLLELTNKNSL